eukprot:m.80291 g.80291  ORF g.80291 m.80291 type:complete len:225 (-) comp9342_c0_seq1:359-1033(-)
MTDMLEVSDDELDALMATLPESVASGSLDAVNNAIHDTVDGHLSPTTPGKGYPSTTESAGGERWLSRDTSSTVPRIHTTKSGAGSRGKAKRDADRRRRRLLREQVRTASRAKKNARHHDIAGSPTTPVHSRGHGTGIARVKRTLKMTKRARAAMADMPLGLKMCRWYTNGLAIDCRDGVACTFHHSASIAAFNRRRLSSATKQMMCQAKTLPRESAWIHSDSAH